MLSGFGPRVTLHSCSQSKGDVSTGFTSGIPRQIFKSCFFLESESHAAMRLLKLIAPRGPRLELSPGLCPLEHTPAPSGGNLQALRSQGDAGPHTLDGGPRSALLGPRSQAGAWGAGQRGPQRQTQVGPRGPLSE